MNPPTDINKFRAEKAKTEADKSSEHSNDIIHNLGVTARKWLLRAGLGTAALGLFIAAESATDINPQAEEPVGVMNVHKEDGSFVQHTVEEGDTLEGIAKAFIESSPDLSDKDLGELTSELQEMREEKYGEDSVLADSRNLMPGEVVSYQTQEYPVSPDS